MKNLLEKKSVILLLIFFSYNNDVKCEENPCNFRTCGECVSYARDTCVWCSQEVFDEPRCRSSKSLATSKTKSWCKKEFIINPQPSMIVTQNRDFGESINAGNYQVIVQLKPQLIKMKTRPGVPMKFNITFKPAKDFPLDVYYLMDTSYTMKSKLRDLKQQAETIYKFLSNYTNNVRLGAGSFVEKPGFPFFKSNKENCTSHAFINHVPLTENMKLFSKTIENIGFGCNLDDPEAGLDALMQAMKCEDQIGWRKGARRIIVLSTDSTYHSAGDGKIVGAIKPNDMTCHLENNTYNMALTYDYPSVSQINKVAIDEKFHIIFAITKNNENKHTPEAEYRALAKQIMGAEYAKLEGGTSVIKIIKEAYEKSARTVKLNYDLPTFIELTVDQDCNSKPTRNCESKHTEPMVTIAGTLTVLSCPSDGNLRHKVEIGSVGNHDNLTIDLEIDCKCDCEKGHFAMSSKCSGAGSLQCGICKCNPGSYGSDCGCNGTSTDQKDMEKCKLGNDTLECSGKGYCICGICETCDTGFSGDFCEFDDNACPSPNNKLCSGNGNCSRGQCECDEKWTGKDCSCPIHNNDCFAPYSKQVCSGNGVCHCGVCVCNALEDNKNETYSGAFCDNCEKCAEKRCKELEDYAYCNYEHMDNKKYCDSQRQPATANETTKDINVVFVNKTEFNGPQLYMAKWCKKVLDNVTYMVFKYQYVEHTLKLTIQKELELPPEANIWVAAGSAIGIVLLIGILTVIIWKILVDLHDKREYRKFAQEAASEGYDVSMNPLYQNPTFNFVNPLCDDVN